MKNKQKNIKLTTITLFFGLLAITTTLVSTVSGVANAFPNANANTQINNTATEINKVVLNIKSARML